MANSITPFLMFIGVAEEALRFYTGLFSNSSITHIDRYGPGDSGGVEGSVRTANAIIAGQPVMVIDSAVKHAFTFTPSISFFVDCESEAELDTVSSALSAGGEVLMPAGNYGFSRKFTWVNDRFGVSWQLNWR